MKPNAPTAIMIGSDHREQGGIGTVLSTYLTQGFLDDKIFLVAHREGPPLHRITLFAQCVALLLWHLLTKPSVRLVHMHMSERGSFFRKAVMGTIAHFFGKKAVFHLHGAEFLLFYANQSPLIQWGIRHTLNTADGLFVLSESWKEDLKALTANPNVFVVYNPVLFDEKLVIRPITETEPVQCLFLGRYGQRKGVYDLVRAVAAIPQPRRNFVLNLHGDGELEQVRALIEELQVSDVIRINGWIRGEAKHQTLLRSDILLLPSYNEGLPVAILEALSYGMAVISTHVGGIAEAVRHQKNGLLLQPGDVAALGKALEDLTTDADRLNRMKLRSRQLCQEHFAHHRIFATMQTLYDHINQTRSVYPKQVQKAL
jgi:glycosyltransferase involved in cell wall biosynthesis